MGARQPGRRGSGRTAGAPVMAGTNPTHIEFQEQVRQLANLYGWHMLTVRRSIGKGRKWTTTTSIVGWPDCLLYRDGRGFVALELKVGKDKPTAEQTAVL